MARLRHRATGTEIRLSSPHLVGRGQRCDLSLDSRLVSGTHAELRWDGSSWELVDLASRNGTYLDGRKLGQGERVSITTGSCIAFGDAQNVFEMIGHAPPSAIATSNDGQRQEVEDGPLALPSAANPACVIFRRRGVWMMEDMSDGECRPVSGRETLAIGAQLWELNLPTILEETWQASSEQLVFDRLTMRFSVSRDEEHVDLQLIQGEIRAQLPSRVCWYTLLTLARARRQDLERGGLSDAEAGWMHVDDLLGTLRIEANTLHQHIFRARQELCRAGVLNFADLVERRPASRQIRLWARDIEIVTL